jgi:FkbM family methyltransferase
MRWLGIAGKDYQKKISGNFQMWLMPKDHIQQQLFWYGYYDKPLGNLLKKIIKPGDVFMDIGANIGYFSMLAAIKEPSANVIAFEPAIANFEKLSQNIVLNKFRNIQTVKAAAGEFNEEKILYLSAEDNMGMNSFEQPENYSGKKEKVKVVRMDDWFRQSGLSRINIIKMDTEGSELSVLNGMKEILMKFKPLLIIEINPETLSRFYVAPDSIISFLYELNYDGYIIPESGELLPLKQNQTDQTINVFFRPR